MKLEANPNLEYFIDKVEVREGIEGIGVYAKEPVLKGSCIFRFKNNIASGIDKNTIQIGKNKHIHGPGLINHGCDPTCYVDTANLELIASRDIQKGEQITFNYLTTEEELLEPFECKCGADNCYGFIRGYKYL